jgi:hypothetical protein
MFYRGLYLGKYASPPPPGGGGEYRPMSFAGKNMKKGREKRENVKKKGEKIKIKIKRKRKFRLTG